MLPKKREPAHPGRILNHEFLKPMAVTQTQFAEHLGCKTAKINEIVNGHRSVTPEMALILADALGTTPEFWLNLQKNYDLWHAQQTHSKIRRFVA